MAATVIHRKRWSFLLPLISATIATDRDVIEIFRMTLRFFLQWTLWMPLSCLGQASLHNAAVIGDLEAIQAQIAMGADLEERDYFGETALHAAVRACQQETIRLLLAERADAEARGLRPDRRQAYEWPGRFVDYSTMERALDLIVRTLRQRAVSWDGRGMRFFVSELRRNDYGGSTPLHMAAERNHADTVASILDAIGGSDAKTDGGLTALHLAALSLVDRPCLMLGRLIPILSLEQQAAIIEASKPAVDVERLIESGADLESRSDHGWTPLYAAVAAGNRPGAVVLLQAGANPNARTETGFTPLHRAAFNGDAEMVSLLINAGANPTARDGRENLPIDYAQGLEDTEVYWTLSDAQF